jgi:transposase InsO family protein
MSMPDEEFDVPGEDELVLLTRRFKRLHENRVNMRSNTRKCFQCGKPGHFVADCQRSSRTRTARSTSRRTMASTGVMTERPCELLHMDLVGPARVRSAGGKWYVLVVVDDYSQSAWVFFLEDKGETFGFVRDLVLRLRNEHGDAIRAIRSDNGLEFRNSRFETFCHDLGLSHQFSSPC